LQPEISPIQLALKVKNRFFIYWLNILLFCLAAGCSIKTIAVRTTGEILKDGMGAFYEEDDLPLAEHALASNLKLIDALIKGDPDNSDLLLLASQAYGGYALGFLETKAETAKLEDRLEDAEKINQRAAKFYLRAKNYALRCFDNSNPFVDLLKSGRVEDMKNYLNLFTDESVPYLFWLAYNWANWINLNLTSPQAISQLPKVVAIMEKVLEMDENYYYGGPHLFFGIYQARPKYLGGVPKKAKEHFEKALEITKGKMLLAKVYYAKFYGVQHQQQELFVTLLKDVEAAPDDIFPEQNLTNQIAKKMARQMLKYQEDLF